MQVPWSGPRSAVRVRPATAVSLLRQAVYSGTGCRGVEVQVGTYSKRQPELQCQQWLRNVKGARSATGTCCTTLGRPPQWNKEALEGRGEFAGCHALLTHLTPCSCNVDKGNWRKQKTHTGLRWP